jgi:hypothetical protein
VEESLVQKMLRQLLIASATTDFTLELEAHQQVLEDEFRILESEDHALALLPKGCGKSYLFLMHNT